MDFTTALAVVSTIDVQIPTKFGGIIKLSEFLHIYMELTEKRKFSYLASLLEAKANTAHFPLQTAGIILRDNSN